MATTFASPEDLIAAQRNATYTPPAWQPGGYSAPQVSYGPAGPSPGVSPGIGITPTVNAYNVAGQQAANAARIPGATTLETASSGNIGNELAGQLPADVMRLIQQQGAERGVATGSPGSPNSNAAYLQALGLTSLGVEEQGQKDLTAALGRNPGAPLFDPTSQLLTPYQQGNLGLEAQRIAQSGGGGGGGGGGVRIAGGGGGVAAGPGDIAYPSTPGGTPYIPPNVDPTQLWWQNIGFDPNNPTGATAAPGSPSSYYAGPNTEEDIAASLGWTGPLSPSADSSLADLQESAFYGGAGG